MQNGHANGAAPGGAQTIQVNPQQAAAWALQFLARAPITRAEREPYDTAEMFLQAIVAGHVILAPPPQAATAHAPAAEPAPPQ